MQIYMCVDINLCVYNIYYIYAYIGHTQPCLYGLNKARLRKINADFPFHH